MTHCVVKACSWYKNKPYVKFFNFPVENEEQKIWLEAARRTNLKPLYKTDGICQFHFDQKDLIIYSDKKKKPRLKKGHKLIIRPKFFPWNFDYVGSQAELQSMEDLGNSSYYPHSNQNTCEVSIILCCLI